MVATLERLKASESPDAITEVLTEHGGVIVEGLLGPDLLARLNAEIDPFVDAANPEMTHLNPAIGFFFGKKTRHVAALAGKSTIFASEVMCHPTFTGICDRVLLPSCARYQLNLGHVIDRGTGSEAQLLHRDELVWVHLARPHPELQVASLTALSDFTAETGATRIAPGSHRWPVDRQPEPHEIADAVMPAGSSVIYLGSTIHGAGTTSAANHWRRGLHISWVLGWLRTEENNTLAVPPEKARKLPRQAQEMLGYAVHDAIAQAGGYLGMVELRDPVELLEEDAL